MFFLNLTRMTNVLGLNFNRMSETLVPEMSSSYKALHDSYVPNRRGSNRIGTIVLAVGCLTVLGALFSVSILEKFTKDEAFQKQNQILQHIIDENNFSQEQSRIVLVESIPLYMKYDDNATFGTPVEKAWKDLLSMANSQVDVASFYWTLTGEDINVNSSTDIPGKEILEQIGALPSRNVSVRVVTSIPSVFTNSTDLQILSQKGVQVRKVPFGRLTGGVLHTKFWIVDRKHIFLGSANMDWRSLTQVKELGVVIYNCSSLANDLHKIFESYWVMGHRNSSIPDPWPSKYDTAINKEHPLLLETENVTSKIYISASPPSFCPASRTQDLEAILSGISGAQHYIDVAVMEYFPTTHFMHPQRYWPDIDDALRRAVFERNVKVRLLVSCGRDSNPSMLPFLLSLDSLIFPAKHASIQVKLAIVPVGNQSEIPHSRVNHNKYMVTDKIAYIGTSNWSADYFNVTAGVGLVISQHGPHWTWRTQALQGQLRAVFDRDWNSQFSLSLADLGDHPDCALSKG
ncbi:5'-3' exonuclease PLD4 isoform X1 [Esox lucius]|uniref:5'-3' exonuclease PLD4 isoform X1 n=2 Tax=Esox lucius TaxID=8010 RepID=UPI0014775E26|nr:5'-3' exonuclease PLD4 isoform X1 [Esox lucius]